MRIIRSVRRGNRNSREILFRAGIFPVSGEQRTEADRFGKLKTDHRDFPGHALRRKFANPEPDRPVRHVRSRIQRNRKRFICIEPDRTFRKHAEPLQCQRFAIRRCKQNQIKLFPVCRDRYGKFITEERSFRTGTRRQSGTDLPVPCPDAFQNADRFNGESAVRFRSGIQKKISSERLVSGNLPFQLENGKIIFLLPVSSAVHADRIAGFRRRGERSCGKRLIVALRS